MNGEFWAFTLSGIMVAWPPVIIGFIAHHWRIKLYIDKRTAAQTATISRLTDNQTADIKTLTDRQTETLTERRRRLRRGPPA